jgi:hypothetical protein
MLLFHTRLIIGVAIGAFCLITSKLSFAATPGRSYQVDVIVFKNLDENARPALPYRLWPESYFSKAINLSSDDLLPKSQSHLKDPLYRLSSSKSYQVLLSQSFISDFHNGVKKTFRIEQEAISPELLENNTYPLVDGIISFVIGRYFDIDIHMQVLSLDVRNQIPSLHFMPFQIFHIEQSLRTSSKKLIYVDNPNYGILLYLSPVEKKNVA